MTAPPDRTDHQATFCSTLVDEWVRRGVRHAMVGPGSRSTPMALALANAADVAVHVFHDERSAAFASLGAGLASGRPAIALCTSGTAAVNFHPAVVEGGLANVPMLVVTADRPPELRDVSAAQTIDQTHLYGRSVRWFHDPGIADEAGRRTWRSLAARAVDAATGTPPGPVHLNLPFREPLVGRPGGPPPATERASRFGRAVLDPAAAAEIAATLDAQRGVIVAGRGAGDPAAVGDLAAALGWPVLADPLSGCGRLPQAVVAFDAIVRHERFGRDHAPQVALRLGNPPASTALAAWLAASGATIVQVTSANVVDPEHSVAHHVVADPSALCRAITPLVKGASQTPWMARWRHAAERAQAAIDATLAAQSGLTEPGVARAMLRSLPAGSSLVVSSSMPMRDVEWYADTSAPVRVLANRGANGIDGVVSTAVGVALETRGPVGLLIGDIAFVHDSNGLMGLTGRDADVRAVVVDNGGGGIFSFLPQATQLDADRFEQLFGTPHGVDVVGLATSYGVPARTVSEPAELAKAVAEPGPWVVRVATDRGANVTVHRQLNAAVAAALDTRP